MSPNELGGESISTSVKYSNVDVVDLALLGKRKLTGTGKFTFITDVTVMEERLHVTRNMSDKKLWLNDLSPYVIL